MPTLHRNGLLGNRPNWYRDTTPSRDLPNEVWVQHYFLNVADSFETGGAYSLHRTRAEADKFKSPFSWYVKSGFRYPTHVGYVADKTLERMLKEKKKAIFETDKD